MNRRWKLEFSAAEVFHDEYQGHHRVGRLLHPRLLG